MQELTVRLRWTEVTCSCVQATDLVNAAAMAQLAAAEEAETAARSALSQQIAVLEAVQAEKAAAAQRMQELQVSMSIHAASPLCCTMDNNTDCGLQLAVFD